jgi:hypothetical protein
VLNQCWPEECKLAGDELLLEIARDAQQPDKQHGYVSAEGGRNIDLATALDLLFNGASLAVSIINLAVALRDRSDKEKKDLIVMTMRGNTSINSQKLDQLYSCTVDYLKQENDEGQSDCK